MQKVRTYFKKMPFPSYGSSRINKPNKIWPLTGSTCEDLKSIISVMDSEK